MDLGDAVPVRPAGAIPEADDRVRYPRAVVAVDDRDDEARRLIAQRALRERPVQAEAGTDGSCMLARSAACSGEPYEQKQDP